MFTIVINRTSKIKMMFSKLRKHFTFIRQSQSLRLNMTVIIQWPPSTLITSSLRCCWHFFSSYAHHHHQELFSRKKFKLACGNFFRDLFRFPTKFWNAAWITAQRRHHTTQRKSNTWFFLCVLVTFIRDRRV